jgi:hypothetical protein
VKGGQFDRFARSPFLLPALLLLGAVISVARGQDAAWDLKNYHLYNAWAFLNGRLHVDTAAAGLQGYFNPLLDIPYFWLGTGVLKDAPRILAAFQGLWYGGTVFVLSRIVLRYTVQRGIPFDWKAAAAVIVGATGTMTLTQAGMSTNELPLALLVLLGFYLVMPLFAGEEPAAPLHRVAWAGVLCGLAAGLKPTAIVYAPALTLAVWAAYEWRVAGLKLAVVIGLSSFAAFVLAYGIWGWQLWQLTGNPVFPMFNQLFHSPWMPATSGTDRALMPTSVAQAVFYPFWWLHENRSQGSNKFADPRYALAMMTLFAYAAYHLYGRFARTTARASRTNRLLFVFVSSSYVFWLALYSILRYAVPIETLTGLVILAGVSEMSSATGVAGAKWRTWLSTAALVACLLPIAAMTRYTDWGHAPFGYQSFDIHPGEIEPNSLVVVLSQPNAYLAPFLDNAEGSRVVGITWLNTLGAGFELEHRVREDIVSHKGPMYALLRDDSAVAAATLAGYLPGMKLDACQPVTSQIEQTKRRRNISEGLRLCKIVR